MSLACASIFPSNSCRSDSIALLSCGAVRGSGLLSVRHPIDIGFEDTVADTHCEQARPPTKLEFLTFGFVRATSRRFLALASPNRKIGQCRH
jgi:hypothetical protein